MVDDTRPIARVMVRNTAEADAGRRQQVRLSWADAFLSAVALAVVVLLPLAGHWIVATSAGVSA